MQHPCIPGNDQILFECKALDYLVEVSASQREFAHPPNNASIRRTLYSGGYRQNRGVRIHHTLSTGEESPQPDLAIRLYQEQHLDCCCR